MQTIDYINKQLSERQKDYIIECEENFSKRIEQIANEIVKEKYEFIFISGPSASGKTTFSHLLKDYLKNYNFINISLDDFYKRNKEMPVKKDGSKNFEAVHSLNIPKIKKTLLALQNNEEVYLPILDFKENKYIEKGKKVKIKENSIVIVEGLHALNNKVCGNTAEDKNYKIFIFPNPEIDGVDRFDLRFIRRMVRDYYYRNAPAKMNFEMWKNVRQGEKIYMPNYKKNADAVMNSFLEYELGVYKRYAIPMLKEIENLKSKRLMNLLNKFEDVDVNFIQKTSLLNEFIYTNEEKES